MSAPLTITNWVKTNKLVKSTSKAVAFTYKNYIYLLGGYNGKSLNYIQRAYTHNDGNLSNWDIIGSVPVSMYGMGYTIIKNRIYLVGGRDDYKFLPTIFSANVDRLNDFRLEVLLPEPIYEPVCFSVNNKFYVLGGCTVGRGGVSNSVYRTIINSDGTLSDNWVALPNLPFSFTTNNSLIIKNKIYIFGVNEFDDISKSKIYCAEINKNDDIELWTHISDIPCNIKYTAILYKNDYLFIIGGYRLNNGLTTNASYRANVLPNGKIENWTQIIDAPIDASNAQIVMVGDNIYFMGGYNSELRYLNTVYSAKITDYIS